MTNKLNVILRKKELLQDFKSCCDFEKNVIIEELNLIEKILKECN